MQRVIHFEIYTRDPEAVCPFYQDVFGWKFKKFEGGPIDTGLSQQVTIRNRESMAVWPVLARDRVPAR